MSKHKHPVRLGLAFAAIALVAGPTSAHHTPTHDQNPLPPAPSATASILHFDAGSIVIPLDGCYARPSFLSDAEIATIIAPSTAGTAAGGINCNSSAEKDDGMIPAYSLVFRLVEDGIPVSWAIKNSKTGWNAVDFSIVKGTKGPVTWRAPGGASSATKYNGITTTSYRGAPFVISATYAAAALAKMDAYAAAHVEYKQVDLHIAQTSFDAPIYKTLTGLPRIAVLDLRDTAAHPLSLHNQKTLFMQDVINDAVIGDMEIALGGQLWEWVTLDDVMSGALANYTLAWVPSFDVDMAGMPNDPQKAFFAKLAEFADGGGSILFQDAAIGAMEGYGTMNAAGTVYTATKPATQNFMIDSGGMIPDGISATWDNGAAYETALSGDYSDPAAQFGGDVWTGIGGSKYNWKPRYDKAYLPGVRRMIYSEELTVAGHPGHVGDDANKRWDFATWRKKDNVSTKGTIYYLGGEHWRRTTAAGFRIVMNTVLTSQIVQPTVSIEVARSSPIIAMTSGVETEYAGTFDEVLPPQPAPTYTTSGDAATFRFPWVTGHMRGLDVSRLGIGENKYSTATSAILFDANNQFSPINYAGTGCGGFPISDRAACRRIFTDTTTGTTMSPLMVVTGNHAALAPLLGVATTADADTLIARIHAGRRSGGSFIPRLGGIDRSTPAVIEQSPLVPVARPTMIYVGARDGMLHAICAQVSGQCPRVGAELWAFLPSAEIGKVRLNATRIDGSPTVADIYGSFAGAARTAKTVLVFQTGNQSPSATYALDISDPANPQLLWKVSTPGPGVRVAMGWVRDLAAVKSFTFIQSAFDPAGSQAGFELRAVETATGEVRWTWTFPYQSPRDPGNPNVPTSAVPGGVTIVPGTGGTSDSILIPTLYGRVFRLDPLTGENKLGNAGCWPTPTSSCTALFDMGEDFHPIGAGITLYRDALGVLHGLVATGGFVDPFSPSGTEWAPDDVHQYAVGFPIRSDVTVTRNDVLHDPTLGLHIDLGAGQRAFSAPVIAGSEVFITTDSTNVNAADYEATDTNTGNLWRMNLSGTDPATSISIRSGAASPDVSLSTGSVLTTGRNSTVLTKPAGFSATGSSTEMQPMTTSGRQLWLRLR